MNSSRQRSKNCLLFIEAKLFDSAKQFLQFENQCPLVTGRRTIQRCLGDAAEEFSEFYLSVPRACCDGGDACE